MLLFLRLVGFLNTVFVDIMTCLTQAHDLVCLKFKTDCVWRSLCHGLSEELGKRGVIETRKLEGNFLC